MSIREVNIASAGVAGKAVLKTSREVDFPDNLYVQGDEPDNMINATEYDIYQIEGDSLCTAHIFSNDFVLAKRLKSYEDKLDILSGSIIALKLEENVDSGYPQNTALYKLRKFIIFIDLRIQDNETLFSLVLSADIRSRFRRNKERFMSKLEAARSRYGEKLITLSVTYKNGERDYSFHSIEYLKGVVEYRVDKDTFEAQKIVPAVDDAKTYKEVIEYLSNKDLNHSFYAISSEEAIIVLSEIFNSSNQEIQLVSNKLSSDICNDKRYLETLKTFLEKDNSKLEIFVYSYEEQNEIYKLFNIFRDKVTIKTSPKGAKFILDKKIINFCIGDGKAYRLETDTECRHSECNFNDTATCNFLKNQFYLIFNNDELSETVSYL